MDPESVNKLRDAVRDVPDFPKEGIVFKDITPILGDPELFSLTIDLLCEVAGDDVDKIVGIDARGFIFGGVMADRLGAGFVPVRKKGKLPYSCYSKAYSLEYGEAEVEIHEDAVKPGEKVFLVDDLLATGGTAAAARDLLVKLDADIIGIGFLIELGFLDGRAAIGGGAPIHAVLDY